MHPNVIHNFGFNLNYTNMLLKDVPDERMAEQPGTVQNHAAWNLGHLIFTMGFLRQTARLGEDPSPLASSEELYNMNSEPTSERSKYPSKDELLAKLASEHEVITPKLATLGDDVLSQQNPSEGFREMMPTVGDAVTFMVTTHYAIHLGEIATWRRAIGMGRLF